MNKFMMLSLISIVFSVSANADVGTRNAVCEAKALARILGGLNGKMSVSQAPNNALMFAFQTRNGFNCASTNPANIHCVNAQTGEETESTIIYIFPALNNGVFDPCTGHNK